MIPAGDIFCANPCGPREPDPRPHTYGVLVCLCAAVATEPCRPTACISAAPFRHTPCRFQPRRTATVWRNLQQYPRTPSSHTFSAKERDAETGLSYFGARYYSSDLSVWLSIDPMSDKYPSLSPYTYCADNPVKLVDPNGEDYEVVMGENTITIKAVYYTASENKEKLQESLDYWNNQSGFFSLEQGDKQYTINFELTLAEGDFATDDEARSAATLDGKHADNFFMLDNPYDQKGATTNGNIIQLHHEKGTSRSLHHEIGHTLGMFHTTFDNNVMNDGGNSDMVIKMNVRQCVKGYYSNHTIIGGSSTHIGKCVNKTSGSYYGKIIQNQ